MLDFFDLPQDAFESTDMFSSTNTDTILGKNIVLNYLGKIEFELCTVGYSDSSIKIAEFYEQCKKKSGIAGFFTNKIIQMILQEIKHRPSLRAYLKTRIFDLIEDEMRQVLDYTLDNNQKLTEKNNILNNNFCAEQEKRRKAINKIVKQKNCTFEEAEKIYEREQAIKKFTSQLSPFDTTAGVPFPLPLPKGYGSASGFPTGGVESTPNEVNLDDIPVDDNTDLDKDSFWEM